MEWKSFNDVLPELDIDVLAVDVEGDMKVVNISEIEGKIAICDYSGYCLISDSIYKYWMPLPYKPKEIMFNF